MSVPGRIVGVDTYLLAGDEVSRQRPLTYIHTYYPAGFHRPVSRYGIVALSSRRGIMETAKARDSMGLHIFCPDWGSAGCLCDSSA